MNLLELFMICLRFKLPCKWQKWPSIKKIAPCKAPSNKNFTFCLINQKHNYLLRANSKTLYCNNSTLKSLFITNLKNIWLVLTNAKTFLCENIFSVWLFLSRARLSLSLLITIEVKKKKYKIEKILDNRLHYRKFQYLIKWLSYL